MHWGGTLKFPWIMTVEIKILDSSSGNNESKRIDCHSDFPYWPMFKLFGDYTPNGRLIFCWDFAHFQWLWIITCSCGQGKEVTKWHHRHWHPFNPRCRRCERNPQKPSLRRCFGGFKYQSSPTPKCSNSPWEEIPLGSGNASFIHLSLKKLSRPCLVVQGNLMTTKLLWTSKLWTPGDSKWPFDPLVGGHLTP